MAKKAKTGNSLVIVESPAKAKTISKYLGPGYTVEASVGHVRDLPKSKKDCPDEYKAEEWAKYGVNVNDNFKPVYVVPEEKKKQVAALKKALKGAENLYLATDEDREGEAISWHLFELLKPKVPVHRLVFNEITKEAIQNSLSNARTIDEGLVRAQETRRILDRLYGYEVSPLLWRKVQKGLSAGRVQSVALRLIVDRERERIAFHSATYWDIVGQFATKEGKPFEAGLVSVDGRKVPSGRDFDAATGLIKDANLMLMDEAAAIALNERIRSAEFKVTDIKDEPYTRKPAAPFTTSTLQQEANRKLGFTARRTMSAAQSLYQNGYITYMRTDSTSLANEAVVAARALVLSEYGDEFLPATPRVYTKKVKNAQEAHEAIRPSTEHFETPDSIKGKVGPDEFKMFDLIWKRTVASQMENARGRRISITLEAAGAVFQVSGKTIDFPGFLRAYVEGSDDPDADLADQEKILPSVEIADNVDCKNLESKSHTTQPPARYSEASLTKALEERGIGRPSTYASIIDTIVGRNYVVKRGNALVPQWVAFSVIRLLESHLPDLIDYQFTAQMEDVLDAISRQEAGHVEFLNTFFFGDDSAGLQQKVAQSLEDVDAKAMSRFLIGKPEDGEEIFVRVGKWGPFIEQGDSVRKAPIPDELAPDELNLEKALQLLEEAEQDDIPLGDDPESGKKVYKKVGRYGPYIQLGHRDDGDEEKPKNAGLLKGMEIEDVTLEVALKLLTLPRTLGLHPESQKEIIAANGRFGPYVKCESDTRSLPEDISPIDVTIEKALELLAEPKTRGRGAPKEPLRKFEISPVTEKEVKLLEGRFGPYVTDGESNASIPKGTEVEDVTFEQALELLAERAARAPKKKTAKKKGVKKKAAKKKAATGEKTTTKKVKKKSVAKKSPAKKKTAKKTPE
ncbi:MAG: DNA topoisomerase-1 [Pirellulaceae bacterium]|jgi:DNA topoisomerase-1